MAMSISREFSKSFYSHRQEIWKTIDSHKSILKQFHQSDLKQFSDNNLNLITLSTMPYCIEFRDDATLEFEEKIEFIKDDLYLYEYSYKYKKEEFYFRYEKQQNISKKKSMTDEEWKYYHPLCHLHVNGKEPRYGTHETNFFEVFHLIRLNFY